MSNEGFRRVVRHYAPKCPINTLFWNKNIKCWFLWLELFIWVWDFSWTIFWWNLAFCLSCPKWCYTYTLPVEIKALEHQTFSTQFISKFKFRLFLITLKLTFFTHPNIKIAKNGNAQMHWRGFHAFFKNSWPSPPPKISHIVTSFKEKQTK